MALDLSGTGRWYPTFPSDPFGGSSFGELLQGTGAPDDANGNNGDTYVDLSSGEFYIKTAGSWTISTGGGGGVAEVSSGVVDPEGVVAKATPHFYVNTDTQQLWFKQTGSGTTGWVPLT